MICICKCMIAYIYIYMYIYIIYVSGIVRTNLRIIWHKFFIYGFGK